MVCLHPNMRIRFFILRFKFDLDTFQTRAFYYPNEIVRSVRAANAVVHVHVYIIIKSKMLSTLAERNVRLSID